MATRNLDIKLSDHLVPHVYGDDDILFVSETLNKRVPMSSLVNEYAKIGMKYTAAIKDQEVGEYTPDHDVMYLQRRFIKRDGFIYGPRDIDKIYDQLNYMDAKNMRNMDFYSSFLEAAFIELILHPYEVYKQFKNDLLDFVRKHKPSKLSSERCITEALILSIYNDNKWTLYHRAVLYKQLEVDITAPRFESSVFECSKMIPASSRVTNDILTSNVAQPNNVNNELNITNDITSNPFDALPTNEQTTQLSTIPVSAYKTDTSKVDILNPYTNREINDILTRPVMVGYYDWSITPITAQYKFPDV